MAGELVATGKFVLVEKIIVAVGNVFQNPASAYTLSGTTITFTSPPANAETITVIHGLDSTTT